MSKRSKLSDGPQQKPPITSTPVWVQESLSESQKHQQTLETTADESKGLLTALKNETTDKSVRWKGDINGFNTVVETLKMQFRRTITGFSQSNTIVFKWLRKTEDTLVNRLYILVIVSVGIILLYSYLAYAIISLATLVVSALFGATMLAAAYVSSRYLRSKMEQHLACVKKSETSLSTDLLVFNQQANPSQISVDNILENIQILEQKVGTIRTMIPSFLSSVSQTTQLEDILKQERQVAANVKSALLIYGVQLNDDAEKYLSNFSVIPDSQLQGSESLQEHAWITRIADALSKPLSTNTAVLQLLYYDFRRRKEYLAAAWQAVKTENESLRQLGAMLTKDLEKLDTATSILIEFKEFDSARFYASYRKYNLESFEIKHSVILAIEHLGLEIINPHRTTMSSFVPKSSKREEILSEVLEESAKLFGIDGETLRLIYLESCFGKDDRSTVDYWSNFKTSEVRLKRLSDALFRGQQPKLPQQYRDEGKKEEILESLRNDICSWKQYSTRDAASLILYIVERVDKTKKDMEKAIEDFKLGLKLDDKAEFESYIPARNELIGNLATKLSELLEHSEQVKLDHRILMLFYHHKLGSAEEDNIFLNLKSAGLMLSLATILLKRGIIQREQGTDLASEAKRVCAILESDSMKRLDLVDLQNLYQSFGEVDLLSERLVNLLAKEGVVQEIKITFDKLIELFSVPSIKGLERLERLERVCKYLLENHCSIAIDKTDHFSVTLSISCLFLDAQQDALSGEAFVKCSTNDFAVKILYHYVKLTKEETTKTNKTGKILAKAIIEVKDQSLRFEVYNDFKTALANRRFYHDFDTLFTVRWNEVHDQMSKKIEKLEKEYSEQRKATKEFLEVNLNLDQLSFAVDSQLIQPYMITVNEHKPMLSQIIDIEMKALCDSKGEKYQNFLLLTDEQEKSAAGYFTRIGIVPIGMNFNKFTEEFMTLYDQATDSYLRTNSLPSTDKERYSANLFRIQLSDLGFKRLERAAQSAKHEHPIAAIKNIIASKMAPVNSVSLYASLQSGETPNTLSKKIITQLFDTSASIIKQIEPYIGKVIADHKGLKQFLEDRNEFDKRLFQGFNCNTFAEFALAMLKAKNDIGSDAKLCSQVTQNLNAVIPKHLKLTLEEIEQVANIIVKKFAYYGGVLAN